jgi:hypothetical protein
MKTRVAIAAKRPNREAAKDFSEKPTRQKKGSLLTVLLPFFCGIAALWWWSDGLQQQQIEAAALEQAQAYVRSLQELGSLSAAEAGGRAKGAVSALLTKAAASNRNPEGAIVRKLHLVESNPAQGKSNGLNNEFAQSALATLTANPGQASWRFEEQTGQPMLHYGAEWKEGDVRGVLELLIPLDHLQSSFAQYRLMLVGLSGGIGLLSLCLAGWSQRTSPHEVEIIKTRSLKPERDHSAPEKPILTSAHEPHERKEGDEELCRITETLAAVTGDLLKVTAELASGAAEMAAGINQTTSTGEEVQHTAALSHQKAQDVATAAQQAAQIAQTGRQASEDTTKEMERIRDQMRTIAESTTRLSEQGQAVREIIDAVNDLAEQSNVLAINAAIEAQKSGTHGSGFTIVAQEVRSLAQQSKDATAQVQVILNEIESAAHGAMQITTQGVHATEVGMQQALEAGEAIRSLEHSAQESAQSAAQISASSQQQMLGIEQLVQAMHAMQASSEQAMAHAQHVEQCAQRLQTLDQRLRTLSARLKGEADQTEPAPALTAEAA